MSFLVVSVVISVAAGLWFWKLADGPRGAARIAAGSFIGALLCLLASTPAMLLQMAGTFLVAVVCLIFNLKNSRLKTAVVAVPCAAYAAVLCWPISQLNELGRLRKEYPLESLAERLKYERTQGGPAQGSTPIRLSGEVEWQLAQFEERQLSSTRRYMLQRLHDQTYADFVLAQGFGPTRMMRVQPSVVQLPDAGPVPLEVPLAEQPPEGSAAKSATAEASPPEALPDKKSVAALNALHIEGLGDLLDDSRMGYVEDLNHVVGFQSHRFSKMPVGEDGAWRKTWRIARLELIGVLKYDQPKAYVSEHLPRLDELAEAATRALDAFEAAALPRLRTYEDLVIDESPERIRMLGSLRTAKDCLQCHQVQRGQLLGALSYTLLPAEKQLAGNNSEKAP